MRTTHKLGLAFAARRAWQPRYLFQHNEAGFLPDLSNPALTLQSAGGAAATAAADPIGYLGSQVGALAFQQATAINKPTMASIPRGGRLCLLNQTDDMNGSAWTRGTTTVSTGALSGPYGVADQLTSNNNIGAYQTPAASSGIVLTNYAVAKYISGPGAVFLLRDDSGAGRHISINMSLGTITGTSGSVTASGVTSLGSGWYLFWMTYTTDSAAVRCWLRPDNGVGTYVYGQARSGIVVGALPAVLQKVTSNFLTTEEGKANVLIPYADGADWMTLGAQSFGTASLFATASQSWAVGMVFSRMAVSGNTSVLLAKCAAVVADRTFRLYIDSSASGFLGLNARGSADAATSVACNDCRLHQALIVWDGAANTLTAYVDASAGTTFTPGTAVEEAQNILMLARTESSPGGHHTGYGLNTLLLDRAPSAAEIAQWRSSTRATYGTPA